MGFDRFLSPKFKHSARFPIVTVMRAVTVTMFAAHLFSFDIMIMTLPGLSMAG